MIGSMQPPMRRPRAVFLDAGGVLVLPDPAVIVAALATAGVRVESERVQEAHYLAVRAIDGTGGPLEVGGLAPAYLPAFVAGLALPPGSTATATRVLRDVSARPSSAVWTFPPPGTFDGLRMLAQRIDRLAVISNSDGTVADVLRHIGLCQVGSGPGVEMQAILDSAVVGVEKPDPRIFTLALGAVGVSDPDYAIHVGDSVRYDVAGATSAGVLPVHFDPYRLCRDDTHRHVGSLSELAESLG
jgi:putative hydrolase of the HAD superfamily